MQATRHARLLVGALILLLPGIPAAQISVAKTADLSFGNLGTSTSAGTAVLNPATGVMTVTSGVVNLGGTQSAASFTVTVSGNPFYTFGLPLRGITLTTLTGPGSTMLVDTFTSNPPCPPCGGKGHNDVVIVGATLHVSANQAQGSYSGSFIVIVNNQ